MRLPALLACTLLLGGSAAAAGKTNVTFRYKPPMDEERPVITDATVGPQGSDFAMRLRFDKLPWGDDCKNRCANATLFLDTDANPHTGLRLGNGAPENGADLAVIIQGARDYKEGGTSSAFLRVKVRQLGDEAKSADDGELLAELNHRQDPERVQSDGTTVYVLVDATTATLPSGRKVRVIYHPPGAKPVQGTVSGMLGSGAGSSVQIFKGTNNGKTSGKAGNWSRAPAAGTK
nr:hypothetical protein [Citreicoccus inhibens]